MCTDDEALDTLHDKILHRARKKIICRALLLNLPTRSGASGMLRVLSDIDSLSSLPLSPIKLKPNIHDRRGEEHLSGRADLQ